MKDVRKPEKAVSEIIGAILLFAIASVLLTSFILWYVPSTGTNNDLTFQGSTQSAFSSLDSKLLDPSNTPGSSISQSFPIGISGTPPFTPTQSTNLYYSNNFNATLNYSLQVNYTNVIKTKTVSVAACANATTSNIINNNYVDQQFRFAVNFQETGLPPGYFWTVTIGGTQESGSPVGLHYADTISFSLPKGSYSYTITSDNQTDLPSPAAGTVKVTNNETTIPVEFANSSSLEKSVVAAAFGSTKNVNAINSANFIGVCTKAGYCDITYPNFWLNKTALIKNTINYYPLASQQFFVYQKNTPVSYLEFYLEPNIVYYEQKYQGVADMYIEISHTPFSTGKPSAFGYLNLTHNTNSNQFCSSSRLENLTLTSPKGNSIELNSNGKNTTCYISFFEAVRESKINATSTGDNTLCFENMSSGYGYGPNEFIGTISNPTISSNNGISYYYEATSYATATKQNFFGVTRTGFHIGSEQFDTSYSSYYFLLGYNIPSSTNNGALIVKESGLSSSGSTKWNFYLGSKDYCEPTSTSTFTINGLPNAQFNYTVTDVGKFIPNPESGFISILPSITAYINISYFEPVGSLPNYWAISNKGVQCFNLSSEKRVNYVSLYLYNFTIPPGSESGNTPTSYVKIGVYNQSNPNKGNLIVTKIEQVSQTGWIQVFLTSSSNGFKPLDFRKGTYSICVKDVTKSGSSSLSGAIGWGFATMGGYDNYLQRVTSDSLSGDISSVRASTVTQYNANSPTTCTVTNESYMYQIGYYNVTVSSEVVPYPIKDQINIIGSINSKGQTQFTLTETEVLQDGIVLSAGKGVTYVTVNPLPIRIVNSINHGISLSSIAYNMSIQKGISTSVSGSGSTIVSMTMKSQTSTNYTVGNSYTFNNKIGPVKSIELLGYNYTIHSSYAKYWADTLYSELLGSGQNYTSFLLFHHFKFKMSGSMEKVSMYGGSVPLYSVNFKLVNFEIDSI